MPHLDHQTRFVASSDGRQLEVVLAGDPRSVPLVHHHGTPHAADTWQSFISGAVTHGLRYVSISRPGYGDSPRLRGRSVADAAADVGSVLDWLDAPRCYTVGVSCGGPHALACAALIGDRVAGAATIGGMAPIATPHFDFFDGMGRTNVEEFRLALQGTGALLPWLRDAVMKLIDLGAVDVTDALGDLVSTVDRDALRGDLAEYVAEAFRLGVASGVWGWHDDVLALVGPWGFDLEAISVPVAVWHGEQDRAMPVGHGRCLLNVIPGARALISRDDGHLSLMQRYPEVVGDLIAATD
jgi:pimeloyl-ACP methyl ester carboxylesterase